MSVYTIDGRRVATLVDENLSAGEHQTTWHGRDTHDRPVASGTYFYRLNVGGKPQVKRMVLLK